MLTARTRCDILHHSGCLLSFLKELNIDADSDIPLPSHFKDMPDGEKIQWLEEICSKNTEEIFL